MYDRRKSLNCGNIRAFVVLNKSEFYRFHLVYKCEKGFAPCSRVTGSAGWLYRAVTEYILGFQADLYADEKITAVKYTGSDYYMLERLIVACPDIEFYTGSDEMFLCGQAVGAHRAIGTTFNFNAEKFIECKKLFAEGKNVQALEMVRKVNAMVTAVIADGTLLAATKYVMTLQGLNILPLAREPFAPLTNEMKDRIVSIYQASK